MASRVHACARHGGHLLQFRSGKKKGTRSRRGEIKTRSRGLVSRPRLRLVHAWADARRTRSFEAMRSIDRTIDRLCPFPRFSNVSWSSNDRSTSSRLFHSIRSSVRRTRCTCTSIQRASSMGRRYYSTAYRVENLGAMLMVLVSGCYCRTYEVFLLIMINERCMFLLAGIGFPL